MKTKLGMLAFIALGALMLNACGDNGGNGPSNSEQAISSNAGSSESDGASSKTGSSAIDLSSVSGGEEQNSGLGVCSEVNDGEIKQHPKSPDIRVVCDNGNWRMATDSEKDVGFGCTFLMIGEERLSAGYMICSQPGIWTVSTHTVAGTMTDPRDGGTMYKTIGIGTQTWMAENLNYEYKVNGRTYGNLCYADSTKYCAQYGRLYTWAAAMDSASTGCGYNKTCTASEDRVQGVCPYGWHLPNQMEWNVLFMAIEDEPTGTALKSAAGWEDGGNGTDTYGFSAYPSGYRSYDKMLVSWWFGYAGYRARFWSSSEIAQTAYYVELSNKIARASINSDSKEYNNYAVRCVKD